MKRLSKVLFLSVLLVLQAGWAIASDHYSTEEGLSSRHAIMAARDRHGFIWIASHGGVDRFDGVVFSHYELPFPDEGFSHQPRGILTGPSEGVFAFDNRFIYKYSPDADRFENLHSLTTNIGEAIHTVKFDSEGCMWIGTSKGLYHSDGSLDNLRPICSDAEVFSIVFDSDHSGWIGTDSRLMRLLRLGNGEYSTSEDVGFPSVFDSRILSLYTDPVTKYLWIGTMNGSIFCFNHSSNKLSTRFHSTGNKPVRFISEYDDSHIWVGLDGEGILEYNRFDCCFLGKYSSQNDVPYHIVSNNVYDMLPDGDIVWICTYTDGIFAHNRNSFITQYWSNSGNISESIADNHVNCILEDGAGRIWFGTNRGVSRFNPGSGKWTHFLLSDNDINSVVLSLCQDASENVWIGGYASDIVYVDKHDRIHRPLESMPEKSTNTQYYAYSIVQSSQGDIWIGGLINQLMRYTPKTREWEQIPVVGVNHIIEWQRDSLIIASYQGLTLLNPENGKATALTAINDPGLLRAGIIRIARLREDPDNLYLGTNGSGVIRFNMRTRMADRSFNTGANYPKHICGLEEDSAGRLWVSTESKLYCLNPSQGYFDVLGEQDGLPDNILNPRAHCRLRNGHIVWGTPSGAFEMSPSSYLERNNVTCSLMFDEFRVFNTPTHPADKDSPLHAHIDITESITLRHDQNSFSFSFINPGYHNAPNSTYSWYLDGWDNDWTEPSSSHRADYINVRPGKYVFTVELSVGDYIIKTQRRSIAVIILQPWWNTTGAWIVYILILVAAILYLFRMYKGIMDAREANKKMNLFTNLAHDMRTPLTLIKAPLNELGNEPLSPEAEEALALARRNTDKLLELATQLLDFQKLDSHAMRLQVQETDLDGLMADLIARFNSSAREKNISINYSPPDPDLSKGYIDKGKVNAILENIISNAIKYTGQDGSIWIKSEVSPTNKWTVKVTDDGIGISKSDKKKIFNMFFRGENAVNSGEIGSGIGLLLTRKMAEFHKGNVSFESQIGVGTTFLVTLPVGKNDYLHSEFAPKESTADTDLSVMAEDQSDTKRLKILIVEDHEDLRKYLAAQLAPDYRVVDKDNATEALEFIKKDYPDFIISDIMMPGISGLEFCKKLKSNIETCHIPVILLTSLAEREDIIKGLNSGADDYVTKPFDMSVLKSKIASVLNNRKLFFKKYCDKSGPGISDDNDRYSSLDHEFLTKAIETIEDRMMNEDFNIDVLAMSMAMSRSVLFKKIKSLTGLNPYEFIRELKMKKAVALLLERKYSIGEVSYLTGYPNAKYFSTAFKKYYGKSPSDYVKSF